MTDSPALRMSALRNYIWNMEGPTGRTASRHFLWIPRKRYCWHTASPAAVMNVILQRNCFVCNRTGRSTVGRGTGIWAPRLPPTPLYHFGSPLPSLFFLGY